ncbi:hypothetical protein GCM10025762_37020 [Haloechinothrix salitolerans]
MLKWIAGGVEDDVSGDLKITKGAAVRSPNHEKVFLIAGEMKAPGVDGEIGVWASNSLERGGGIIMAVDNIAQAFTVYPDADKTDAQISPAAAGVQEARDCLD